VAVLLFLYPPPDSSPEGALGNMSEPEMGNYSMVPEVELEEALRWCFRHYACLDFFGDSDRNVYLRLTVPLRNADQDCHRVTARLYHHDNVGADVRTLVEEARKELGYE
jgi:hypothetical protein